jgi:hypothetical protein
VAYYYYYYYYYHYYGGGGRGWLLAAKLVSLAAKCSLDAKHKIFGRNVFVFV